MKIVYFNFAAIVVFAITLATAIFRKMTHGRANKMFLATIIEMVITTIFAIFCLAFDNKVSAGGTVPRPLLYAAHFGYLATHNLTALFYMAYLITLTDRWHLLNKKKWVKPLSLLPISIEMILLVLSLFNGWIFYIDDALKYTRGFLFPILYVFGVFYLILGLIYIVHSKKLFTTTYVIVLFIPYPLIFAAMIAEYFVPLINIEMFANAIGMLFVFQNIQRPEEYMDQETGLSNDYAFRRDCIKAFTNEKVFGVIAINIQNYENLKEALPIHSMRSFLKEISLVLKNSVKKYSLDADCYYIHNGQFRISLEQSSLDNLNRTANDIANQLAEKQHFIYPFNENIYIIHCPEDVKNYDELKLFEGNPLARENKDNFLWAGRIVEKDDYKLSKELDHITDEALKNNSFMVYFQPILDMKTGRFRSAEALLRLKHESFGFINPEKIITAAEKSGRIFEIGSFVLRKVCEFIASEEFKTLGVDYIEVNTSVAECMKETLADHVLSTLKEYGVSPSQINLEITETAVAKSGDIIMNNLKKLGEAGIHFSLDDFGSGYSNLERVAKLPLSMIKIDKTVTDNFSADKGKALLKNIIQLGLDLNLETIVEGVETQEQSDAVLMWGGQFIQGYFYSKPLCKDDYVAFLKAAASK